MCCDCFRQHAIGVGLDKGQRLWLPHERHAHGAVPVRELPPLREAFLPKEAFCGGCGAKWFEHALAWREFVGYCPGCTRRLADRESGPFTFGDVLSIDYPAGEWAGHYLAKLMVFLECGAIRCRFLMPENGGWISKADSQLYRDGIGVWWDVDYSVSGLTVRLAGEQERLEWERRLRQYGGQIETESGRRKWADVQDVA
jgi:hypothetical protein